MSVFEFCNVSLFNKKANNGFSVFFGHENWDLVLNMMIGIRIAAGRSHLEPRRLVHKYDFLMKEKFSIIPQIHEDKKVGSSSLSDVG